MSAENLVVRNRFNYQPNVLTESRQHFTLAERNIVLMVINQLDRKREYSDRERVTVRFPLTYLKERNYDRVKEASRRLNLKHIAFDDDRYRQFSFLSPFPSVMTTEVNGQEGLEVEINRNILPVLLDLKSQYTKVDIEIILSLKSVYSQRIYEYICMYKGRRKTAFEISVEDFITKFNAPAAYTYKQINTHILQPVQRELQATAGIGFEYGPGRKIGKKVTTISFKVVSVKDLEQGHYKEEIDKWLDAMDRIQLMELRRQLVSHYQVPCEMASVVASSPVLSEKLVEVHYLLENGYLKDVQDPIAYMNTCLRNLNF